jgi:hypothetical protein
MGPRAIHQYKTRRHRRHGAMQCKAMRAYMSCGYVYRPLAAAIAEPSNA